MIPKVLINLPLSALLACPSLNIKLFLHYPSDICPLPLSFFFAKVPKDSVLVFGPNFSLWHL